MAHPDQELDHNCEDYFFAINHPANAVDYNLPGSSQGYQVYICTRPGCATYYGVRYQYDSGTGRDDRVHRFGTDPSKIRRHY